MKFRLLILSLVLAVGTCSVTNAEFVVDDYVSTTSNGNPGSTYTIAGSTTSVTRTETQNTGILHFPGPASTGPINLIFLNNDGLFTLNYTLSKSLTATDQEIFASTGSFARITQIFLPVAVVGDAQFTVTANIGTYSETLTQNDISANGNLLFEDATGGIENASTLQFVVDVTFAGTGLFDGAVLGGGGVGLLATPEPAAFMMFASVAAVGFVRRRRR